MKILSLFFTAILANQCKKSANWDKKPGFCTDVTTYITRTNSWVCKNCFNIRIEFNLGWLGPVGKWFDNRDFVWLAFKQPVSVIKWAGPSDGVVADGNDEHGNFRFKMGFNDQAQFGDGRIDINVEFNDNDTGELVWAKLCPCGESDVDGCDASHIGDDGVGGFWHCGYWHRAGPEELRMAKCYYMCHGDLEDKLDESENWFTGAKGRCFREQGKNHRPGARNAPRKFRELFEWELGRNSGDKLDCTSGKGLKAKDRDIQPKTGGSKGGGKLERKGQ